MNIEGKTGILLRVKLKLQHITIFHGVESTFLRDYHEVERLAINSQRAETKICTVGTLLREDPRQYYSSTTKRSGEFSPGYHIVKSKDRKPRFNNNQEFFRAQVTCYKDDWIDYLRLVRRITRQS